MRYRGIVFRSLEKEDVPSMVCITIPFRTKDPQGSIRYGLTMPIGMCEPGKFGELIFPEISHNRVLISEIMLKYNGRPITVEEHHRLFKAGMIANNGIYSVLIYTLAVEIRDMNIPVEKAILLNPTSVAKTFYKAVRKAERNKKFNSKALVSHWKKIDNAKRREIGRALRLVPTPEIMIVGETERVA